MTGRRTITSVFGAGAANELAAIAIDLLCDPSATRAQHTRTAYVAWDLIEEGREIMERHGIQWRTLKADNERPVRI